MKIFEYILPILIGVVFGTIMFYWGHTTSKQPRWNIPPNAIAEYKDRICYMWKIPTAQHPRYQYIYCEDRHE